MLTYRQSSWPINGNLPGNNGSVYCKQGGGGSVAFLVPFHGVSGLVNCNFNDY